MTALNLPQSVDLQDILIPYYVCVGGQIFIFFSIQIISHVGLCLRGKNLIYERAFVNYRT